MAEVAEEVLPIGVRLRFALFGLECTLGVSFNGVECERVFSDASERRVSAKRYLLFESPRLVVSGRVDEHEPESIWLRVQGGRGVSEVVRRVIEGSEFHSLRLSQSPGDKLAEPSVSPECGALREIGFAHELFRLERELAATIRQFSRAADAHDDTAKAVEVDAIADRIRRMLSVHLEIRIGMSSDAWVWLDSQEKVQVEMAETEMRASGRILCTFPNGPWRQWTEPFAAVVTHGNSDSGLSDYTIALGARATLLDLAAVERHLTNGETASPPAPASEDGWAYIFRLDDRRENQSGAQLVDS